MEKTAISKNQIINQLLKIGHGDLSLYIQPCLKAIYQDADMFGHLIAWNQIKGEVRDSKAAFPAIALRGPKDNVLLENAVAHMLLLDPRTLVRSVKFYMGGVGIKDTSTGGSTILKQGIHGYIKARESDRNWWTRTVLQHKSAMKSLYALFHVKPNDYAQMVLFRRRPPFNSVFDIVGRLKDIGPMEAAGCILQYKIPFTVALGALGGIKDKPDIIIALMDQMSGNELITNTKMLEKLGVFADPVLQAAYTVAVDRARTDKKMNVLKAGKAAETVKKVSEKAAKKLDQIQEQGLDTKIGNIEGDWGVLADRSGSQAASIELGKQIAGLIARQVKGTVDLVFFNEEPLRFDVTGKTLDEIKVMTSRVNARGGTNIGCSLASILEKGILIQGIALCSDGGENGNPWFAEVYKKYVEKMGIEPTIYFYHLPGDPDVLSVRLSAAGIPVTKFEMGANVDYYSLPMLTKTMRTSRFGLLDEIMETRLLTVDEVLKRKAA